MEFDGLSVKSIKYVMKGSHIFSEGESGSEAFLILEGSADIYKKNAENITTKIAELGPGHIIGEMALFGGGIRTATVIANSSVVLYSIDKEIFEKILNDNNPFTVFIVKNIVSKLKSTSEELVGYKNKDFFIRNLGHELKSPLTSILCCAQALENEYFGDLNSKQREYIKLINSSGEHLLGLINGILALTSIEAGTTIINKEYFSLFDLTNEILLLMKPQFELKKLKLESDIDVQLTSVFADKAKYKQILFNLISNAMKYTSNDGVISVIVKKINDSTLKCSVRDNGVGISQKDQMLIFNEFYQTDYTKKQGISGSGIGLTVTKKLVEMHGGEIGLESTLNEGSTFWFTLPIGD